MTPTGAALRLCVIGNSHLAAIKLGWDAAQEAQLPLTTNIAPVFFGAPRDGMRHVRLQEGCLIPLRKDITDNFRQLSGGQDRIPLADFDAFLLVGLNVSIKRIMRFYKTHVWAGLAGSAGKVMVSAQFAAEFLTERYGDTRLAEIARTLRAATDRPILALAEPHWASWVRMAHEGPDYGWDAAIRAGDGPAIGAMFARTAAAALGPDAVFVPQPPRTIEDGIVTAAAFNKGASKLIGGEGGGTDASHMNGAYGLEFWPRIAAALQG